MATPCLHLCCCAKFLLISYPNSQRPPPVKEFVVSPRSSIDEQHLAVERLFYVPTPTPYTLYFWLSSPSFTHTVYCPKRAANATNFVVEKPRLDFPALFALVLCTKRRHHANKQTRIAPHLVQGNVYRTQVKWSMPPVIQDLIGWPAEGSHLRCARCWSIKQQALWFGKALEDRPGYFTITVPEDYFHLNAEDEIRLCLSCTDDPVIESW